MLWFSRTQCVTLSTTEAEYVTRGDLVKEGTTICKARVEIHVASREDASHSGV